MKAIKWLNLIVMAALLVALAPAATPAAAQTATPGEITRDTPFVPGEVVVAFDTALKPAEFQAKAAALAGEVSAEVVEQFDTTALLSFDPAVDVPALAAQLAGAEGVRYAEPNYISWIPEAAVTGTDQKLSSVTRKSADGHDLEISVDELLAMRTRKKVNGVVRLAATYPNDIFSNWGNDWIGQTIVWPTANVSPMVCVIDTGVDINHPELKGLAVNGFDFVNNDAVANDDHGHGTHVSGTVAARNNNGTNGMAGISNGKVLAVKVLSAQGWGTDMDIAMGIRFCANNPAVKVLNMSLGGSGSLTEYEALDYAIKTKGKLVVAAAGNDSTSDITSAYPAAWADVDNLAPDALGDMNQPNTIHAGLISVGAARSPWSAAFPYDYDADGYLLTDSHGNLLPGVSDGAVWIDTDGDGVVGSEDDQQYSNCATDFSNYGSWVEIVAPGEDIFSSTPVNYPFYEGYMYGVPGGYDSWGGTSMATPHVAGAAARLWSINPAWSASQIAARLHDTGRELDLAVDPDVPANEVTDGYLSAWGAGGEAPFCWPNQDGNFTLAEDMTNSTYLNLAAAMDRMALTAGAVDASTGLPLAGAQIQAATGATVRATAQIVSNYTRWVDLINLPYNNVYTLKVSKAGQTSGFQNYYWLQVPEPGWNYYSNGFIAPVPGSMKDITVVANWYSGNYDLDLYLWLPKDDDTGGVNNSAVVGPGSGYAGSDYDYGPGALYQFPRARWFRDGGGGDTVPVESITIAKSPLGAFPYYWDTLDNGYLDPYEVLMTDNYYAYGSAPGFSILSEASPILRVWSGGKILPIWDLPSGYGYYAVEDANCEVGEDWWWPVRLYRWGSTFYADSYGTPDIDCASGLTPYTDGGMEKIQAQGKVMHSGR